MTTRCLSFIQFDTPQVLNNRRHYAALLGYTHDTVSLIAIQSQAHRLLLNKYEAILHHLRGLPDMGSLVCFTEDCLVLNPHHVEPMIEGRQHLLMAVGGNMGKYQTAVQIWRNTPDVRQLITRCIEH